MFSRKRHFYEKKTFYAAVVTAFSLVLSLSLWMGGEAGEELEKDPAVLSRDEAVDQEQPVSSQQVDTNIGQAGITGGNNIPVPVKEGYFAVEEDGYIKVYQTDSQGESVLIRTTDILFALLGSEDQELFRQGIYLESEDDLMELLQDFES